MKVLNFDKYTAFVTHFHWGSYINDKYDPYLTPKKNRNYDKMIFTCKGRLFSLFSQNGRVSARPFGANGGGFSLSSNVRFEIVNQGCTAIWLCLLFSRAWLQNISMYFFWE